MNLLDGVCVFSLVLVKESWIYYIFIMTCWMATAAAQQASKPSFESQINWWHFSTPLIKLRRWAKLDSKRRTWYSKYQFLSNFCFQLRQKIERKIGKLMTHRKLHDFPTRQEGLCRLQKMCFGFPRERDESSLHFWNTLHSAGGEINRIRFATAGFGLGDDLFPRAKYFF